MPRLYTTQQAAEYIGVKIRNVQHLCKAGRIKAQKIGRDWFIFGEDLEKYVKSRRSKKKIEPAES